MEHKVLYISHSAKADQKKYWNKEFYYSHVLEEGLRDPQGATKKSVQGVHREKETRSEA